MKIQTVNQLISVFKDISTRHYQINGFGIGDDWENGASEAKIHPVLWINPTTANMPATENGYKTFEIDFEVRVFDLVNKDESNENEVLSDCIDILKDIITEFKGHPYYVNSQLNIIDDIGFEAFTEEFDEEVSGWVCEISLMTPILNSFCGIPAADITGFEFPGTDCPDVNVLCPVFVEDVTGVSPIVVTTIGTTKQISFEGGVGSDVFVVSGSYNTGTSNLELLRNDGVTVLADLSSINTTDTHLTSAVYDNSTTSLDLTLTDGTVFNVDLSALKDDTNTHLTNLVFNASNDNNLVATLNDGTVINSLIDNFDDLTVNGDVNATNFIGDGSQLTNLPSSGGASGVLGIANSLGEYTYYDTFALALAAASSGDTIQLFTNIIETSNTTVNCVNGVNINFNGFTYTLNSSGNAHAFTISGSSVSIELFNGKVLRTGNGSGSALYVSTGNISLITVQSVVFENDFGTSASINSSSTTLIGGYYYGAGMGMFVNQSRVENIYARGGSSYGLWIHNNGTAVNSTGYSLSNYGIENNNSNAYTCTGRSSGSIGFNAAGGSSFDCQGYSTANIGFKISSTASKFSNIFGYSSGGYGVSMLGTGINITGYSTSSYGVFYQSGSGNDALCSIKAFSTSAIALYIFKNAGKVELSNIDASCSWANSSGHAVEVTGVSNEIRISGGSLRVSNTSANCLFSGSSKNCYFTSLNFSNSTVAVNPNITNLQSNSVDSFGNILIG